MEPNQSDKDELLNLSEIYENLRKDAKSLTKDLLEGVELWRSYGGMLLCVSVLGFFLALLSLDHELLSFGLMLVETFAALTIGIAGAVGYFMTLRKYSNLRKKYKALFEAAKRMN